MGRNYRSGGAGLSGMAQIFTAGARRPKISVTRRAAGVRSRSLVLLLLGIWCIAAEAGEIVVSAAASLTSAFGDIGKAYAQAHPGERVVFNFAASGALLTQIARGAPVDVFASADQDTMDRAQQQGLIAPGSRADFARNTLVVVVPAGAGALPRLADLQRAQYRRIAISNPDTVPAGRYARAALEAAGLWAPLQPRMINTLNVRQSLDYVSRGEVDAGFVYATDARAASARVTLALHVPTRTPITYPIAAVNGGGNGESAARFVRFVNSGTAREILARHGFLAP